MSWTINIFSTYILSRIRFLWCDFHTSNISSLIRETYSSINILEPGHLSDKTE